MAIKPNVKLLMAIRENGMRQNDFALKVGDHFTRVSRVVNGRENLDDRDQAKYAEVLNRRVEEIFT